MDTPRPIHPDDLFKLQFLQDAQFSPDGQSIVYSITHIDAASDVERSTLWLQIVASGETRQLTTGQFHDSNPCWSPDGSQIAFLSQRENKSQLYLLPFTGGEAQQLTALPQGVSGPPVWSPDGKQLAFTTVRHTTTPDPKQPYRITRHIYRHDLLGYVDPVMHDVYTIAATGGDLQQLTEDACHNTSPVWSPNGQRLLYLVSMFPDSHNTTMGLRSVTLSGAVEDVVLEWGSVSSAVWSPDGERIIFIGKPHQAPIGAKNDLWVLDVAGGHPQCRTSQLDFHVGGAMQPDMPPFARPLRIYVTDDAQSAYVQVQVGGMIRIYRVALVGPERCEVIVDGERTCFLLDMSRDRLLYVVSTMHNPITLYSADLAGGKASTLVDPNADLLREWADTPVEHLRFSGQDGTSVEGWLMCPAGASAPFATILYIHGGPHLAFGHLFSFDFKMLTGAGYAVLFINHRASTGYGDAFSTRIMGDWGNHDYTDLMAGVDYAIAQGLVDPERMGVCGLSGGAYLSCWIVGQTDRFKAAVPENPVTNWVSFYGVSDIGPYFAVRQLGGHPHEIPEVYARCSPITYAHRCTTPTLLIQGEADYRCPPEQSEQFYTVLKANGCPVEMLRLPNSAHTGSITGDPVVRRAQNQALLEWMQRYV